MPVVQRQRIAFAFGPYTLISGRQILLRDHSQVRLGGRAFDILHLLVQRAGELVSKEALIDFAWPRTFVSDSNLRVQVRKLRHALGDVRGQPIYIASIARRGYRFVADVSVEPIRRREGVNTLVVHALGVEERPPVSWDPKTHTDPIHAQRESIQAYPRQDRLQST